MLQRSPSHGKGQKPCWRESLHIYNDHLSFLGLCTISLVVLLVQKKKMQVQNMMAIHESIQWCWCFVWEYTLQLKRLDLNFMPVSTLSQNNAFWVDATSECKMPASNLQGITKQRKQTWHQKEFYNAVFFLLHYKCFFYIFCRKVFQIILGSWFWCLKQHTWQLYILWKSLVRCSPKKPPCFFFKRFAEERPREQTKAHVECQPVRCPLTWERRQSTISRWYTSGKLDEAPFAFRKTCSVYPIISNKCLF